MIIIMVTEIWRNTQKTTLQRIGKKIEIKYSLCQFCPISKKKCEQSYTNQWEVKNLLDSWFCSCKKTPIESTMAVLKKSIGHWQVFSVWFRFILIFFLRESTNHLAIQTKRRPEERWFVVAHGCCFTYTDSQRNFKWIRFFRYNQFSILLGDHQIWIEIKGKRKLLFIIQNIEWQHGSFCRILKYYLFSIK